MEDKLPNRLSELIRVALKDLRKAFENGYEISMDDWWALSSREDTLKPCQVCFAGAMFMEEVFPQVNKNSILELKNRYTGSVDLFSSSLHGQHFPMSVAWKMYALNEVRRGTYEFSFFKGAMENMEKSCSVQGRYVLAEKYKELSTWENGFPVVHGWDISLEQDEALDKFTKGMSELADWLEKKGV